MRVRGTRYRFFMKTSYSIIVVSLLLMFSCKKEEPEVNLHSGLTRIEYSVTDPFEMPRLEFTFITPHNLIGHTEMILKILTNEESGLLNLSVMLEDADGHRNDEDPVLLLDDELISDNTLQTYQYDLREHLGSVTSGTGEVDLTKIEKVYIYINAGLTGKISSGSFWLDSIRFIKSGD
jgi:hypothetical protein